MGHLRLVSEDQVFADLFGRDLPRLDTDASRAREWELYVRGVHEPAEAQLSQAWAGYFRDASRRYAQRLAEVLGESRAVSRVIDPGIMARILAEGVEFAAARLAVGDVFGTIVRIGFEIIGDLLGLSWEPASDVGKDEIGQEIVNVSQLTKQRVRLIVEQGIAEGATIAEMQSRIQTDVAFSPVRALRVARTETTRLISLGQEVAYQDAANRGVALVKVWISARDGAVRDSHRDMDGQERRVGEPFALVSGPNQGREAEGPGTFMIPEEDINCRCTTRPKVL